MNGFSVHQHALDASRVPLIFNHGQRNAVIIREPNQVYVCGWFPLLSAGSDVEREEAGFIGFSFVSLLIAD